MMKLVVFSPTTAKQRLPCTPVITTFDTQPEDAERNGWANYTVFHFDIQYLIQFKSSLAFLSTLGQFKSQFYVNVKFLYSNTLWLISISKLRMTTTVNMLYTKP
uniref:Uncharacterized protein n=1 Tax=Glossina palpalis gambiensis TaxID=67801 RepID=A0A1B0BH92_9MUSC